MSAREFASVIIRLLGLYLLLSFVMGLPQLYVAFLNPATRATLLNSMTVVALVPLLLNVVLGVVLTVFSGQISKAVTRRL